MTDDKRPDLEWPSEDLAQPAAKPKPSRDVEWPSADTPGAVPTPTPGAPEPFPERPPEPVPQAPEPPFPAPEPVPQVPEPQFQPPVAGPQLPLPPPLPSVPEVPPIEPAIPLEPPPGSQLLPESQVPPTYQQAPGQQFGGLPPSMTPPTPGPYTIVGRVHTPEVEPASDEKARSHFRPDIEGLRAVAVMAVLLFHIGLPLTSGGFVGVDVFYVISGFLITGLLLREGEETGKVDLLRFYARRMRRLLPAALLVIVVTLAAAAVIVTPLRLTEIAGDAAASALYVANFRFALDATNYLALDVPSPLLHYWSLGVEEQFYLVWPLILLVATRILSLRFVGVFILVLAIASFGLSYYLTDTAPAWAFFSPFTRAWELAAGALIAVGLVRIPRRAPGIIAAISVWLGLALIIVSVFLVSDETPFPGIAAILPVVGAVLVIVGGLSRPTLPGRLLSIPPARYLGRISYSLYLWHWPILILVPMAIGNDELEVRVALAVVAIIVAAISTELIEQPFRRSGFLSRNSFSSVQLGLTGSVAVGVVALIMSGAINVPTPWIRPDPVVVELAGVRNDLPRSYSDGCHLTFEARKPRTDCVYGDPDGEKTAFLIGDSHAAQWVPALDVYAADKGWRLEVHTKSACSVAPVPLWERKLRRTYDECEAWRTALIKRIKKADPEVVYVGSSRDYELWDSGRIIQTSEAQTYWQEQLTTLMQTLGQQAGRVVLLAETPFLNFDPIDCLADDDIDNCDPPARIVVDTRYAALEAAAADDGGATLLSINELLCPGVYCPVVVDDIVVFRDKHHVTASFMEHLAGPIGNLLEGRAPYPTPSPSLEPLRPVQAPVAAPTEAPAAPAEAAG